MLCLLLTTLALAQVPAVVPETALTLEIKDPTPADVYTVSAFHLPLPDGELSQAACAAALDGATTGASVTVRDETFQRRGPVAEASTEAIKRTLGEARLAARRGHFWSSKEKHGHLLSENSYDRLVALTLEVSRGRVRRLVEARREDGGVIRRGGRAVLVPSAWTFARGGDVVPSLRLLAAEPGDPDVRFLSRKGFERVPAAVRLAIRSFDARDEMLELPHSVTSYNIFENTCSNMCEVTGVRVFSVGPAGAREGYLVEYLIAQYVEEPQYIYGVKEHQYWVRYRMRFAPDGQRVDAGKEVKTIGGGSRFKPYEWSRSR